MRPQPIPTLLCHPGIGGSAEISGIQICTRDTARTSRLAEALRDDGLCLAVGVCAQRHPQGVPLRVVAVKPEHCRIPRLSPASSRYRRLRGDIRVRYGSANGVLVRGHHSLLRSTLLRRGRLSTIRRWFAAVLCGRLHFVWLRLLCTICLAGSTLSSFQSR